MTSHKLILAAAMAAFVTAGLMVSLPLVTSTAWAQEHGDMHKAVGTVKAVDEGSKKVTIEHGPVESLGWRGMTMDFTVSDPAILKQLAPGKKVEFQFMQHGNMFMIMSAK